MHCAHPISQICGRAALALAALAAAFSLAACGNKLPLRAPAEDAAAAVAAADSQRGGE